MTKAKRFLSVLMVLVVVFTSFGALSFSAAAATTSSKNVVTYNVLAGGTASARTNSYTITGNFWTKRKITIYGSSNFPNETSQNAFSKLARFDIVVKQGKNTISTYNNVSFGFKFYLPKWSKKKYTVTVTGKFSGYNKGNAYHQTAALTGKYYLKY